MVSVILPPVGKHLSQASTGRFLQMEFHLVLSPWVGEEAVEVLGSGRQHNLADWKLPPLTDDGGVTTSGHLMLVPREGNQVVWERTSRIISLNVVALL